MDWRRLQWTGEHTAPEEHNTQFLENFAKYHFIQDIIKDKIVLDVGCGFGYGTYFLSREAKKIIGIDICKFTIEEAKRKYQKDNLEFIQMDGRELNFSKDSFDCVCCIEVIEHIDKQDKFLEDIFRILKPGGYFLLSTPRRIYERPQVIYHKHEFNAEELSKFLNRRFNEVKIYGLQISAATYELERALTQVRKIDIFKIRNILPRRLISKIAYVVARLKGIKPAQEMGLEEFKITEENIEEANCLIAIAKK